MNRQKRILVIDDEPQIREMFINLFNLNYPGKITTDEASNGEEALKLVKLHKYDCIITDLTMPKVGGEEFIRKLRKGESNYSCPVVVVSGNPLADLIKEFSYLIMLSKPFNKKDFLEIFNNQLMLKSNTNRVSGAVLNAFITEMAGLIEKKTKTNAEFSKLRPKTEEHIPNNLCIKVEIGIGNTLNTYIIGLNKSLALKVKKRFSFTKMIETDIILTLLSKTRDIMQTKYGFKDIQFKNTRLFQDEQAEKCLRNSEGIMMKIGFDAHDLHIVATSGTLTNPDSRTRVNVDDYRYVESRRAP